MHAELACTSVSNPLLCDASLTVLCKLKFELQCTLELCTATKVKQLDAGEGALLASQLYLQVVGPSVKTAMTSHANPIDEP